MKIAIIGAGLAGCACAYVFARNGHKPVIYEASNSIASGASGNRIGLYNPRFTASRGVEQEFYDYAFKQALEVFERFDSIFWNPCGALHLVTDEKKAKRFPQTVENWNWGSQKMRMVSASEASLISGVPIDYDALYLSQSGTISPHKLCYAYSRDVDVHFNTPIENPDALKADAIIIACGITSAKLCKNLQLALKPVRGQVTYIQSCKISEKLNCTIGYGGYISPPYQNIHCVGSSFQPWLNHTDVIESDDTDNLKKLFSMVPSLRDDYNIVDRHVGVRTTIKDHFPVVGRVFSNQNIYISTAHGSHGIVSSLAGAYLLSDLITGKNSPLSSSLHNALSIGRFSSSIG